MPGTMAVGMLVYTARFIYDALIFSTEWCIFLILLMSIYKLVTTIVNRVRDCIILWAVMFSTHIFARFMLVYTDERPDNPGVLAHSARFIYDAFLFSIEWSIFAALLLAVYSLIMLLISHLRDAVIMWGVIFICHLLLRVAYSKSNDFFDW